MANAYPQALGMAKVYPGRQVVALAGDGGLSMLMGDLLTPCAGIDSGQTAAVQQWIPRFGSTAEKQLPPIITRETTIRTLRWERLTPI
jgi:hypothetical protein